jgi:Uma2 family endonuclease
MAQVMRSLVEQHEFNLARWEELENDPEVRAWPGRVETDREGNAIMIPPGDVGHGMRIIRFGNLFTEYMPHGIALGEFAVSTSDGNKIPDCGWASEEHPEFQWLLADEPEAQERPKVLKHAPEICAEILSPSNTPAEIEFKKRLYFEVGAKEVWVCDLGGAMKFFGPEGELPRSKLCPDWPQVVPLRGARLVGGERGFQRELTREREHGSVRPRRTEDGPSKERKQEPER